MAAMPLIGFDASLCLLSNLHRSFSFGAPRKVKQRQKTRGRRRQQELAKIICVRDRRVKPEKTGKGSRGVTN
jgi:hypothetical protein